MNETQYLEALVLRFERQLDKLFRLKPEAGGLNPFTYFAGKQIVEKCVLRKGYKMNEEFDEICKAVDDFCYGCGQLIETSNGRPEIIGRYNALRTEAGLIKSVLTFQSETYSLSHLHVMQENELAPEEADALKQVSSCPSCGADDIIVVNNTKTGRYYVACNRCGGRFRARTEFDSINCALDVWNLCCSIMNEMVKMGDSPEPLFGSEDARDCVEDAHVPCTEVAPA